MGIKRKWENLRWKKADSFEKQKAKVEW